MAFAPGMQIGKYLLRRQLGVGGYALVFAAHDPSLDREIALKLLKPEHASSEVVVRRFLQEARAAVRIVHPGIVTVFECGQASGTDPEADSTAYIAMELLDGETLADRTDRGSLGPMAAIEIGRQLAAALEAAHRAGIVHRDLKPENVFLVEDSLVPGGERAKVLDFGIAKLGQAVAAPGMQTGSLTVLGTPRYMSPEQCRSAARIDHRTDIYALGAMLFELFAGRPPFDGPAVEVIAQHLMLPPPSLLELVPDMLPEVAALIGRMLEKEPDARPASMEAVQRELEVIADAAGLAPARPSAMPGGLPQLRLATVRPADDAAAARPADDTATTLISLAGASRAPARRASGGPRRGFYAAASLLGLGLGLGGFFLLHAPGDAPGSQAQAEGSPDGPVERRREPAPPVAGGAGVPDPGAAPAEVAQPLPRPGVAPARSAGARAKPAAPAFGLLALSARPACEIYIDGRPLGARTPLKDLRLPAGRHRITLVNNERAIHDTFAVAIGAGATERVARDYSGQLKRDQRDETINPFASGGPGGR